jgi:hypothetical protein
LVFFPEVQGGKGKANDIFGSVYGWLVSKDAPKETVEFMKVWLGKNIQTKIAASRTDWTAGSVVAVFRQFLKAASAGV